MLAACGFKSQRNNTKGSRQPTVAQLWKKARFLNQFDTLITRKKAGGEKSGLSAGFPYFNLTAHQSACAIKAL
jgi:hypothetical protein